MDLHPQQLHVSCSLDCRGPEVPSSLNCSVMKYFPQGKKVKLAFFFNSKYRNVKRANKEQSYSFQTFSVLSLFSVPWVAQESWISPHMHLLVCCNSVTLQWSCRITSVKSSFHKSLELKILPWRTCGFYKKKKKNLPWSLSIKKVWLGKLILSEWKLLKNENNF